MAQTKMTNHQVVNWFINARRRYLVNWEPRVCLSRFCIFSYHYFLYSESVGQARILVKRSVIPLMQSYVLKVEELNIG